MKTRKTPAIAAFAIAAAILWAPAGLAHSTKENTTPSDGAVLPVAPDLIAMTFDHPMRITMVRLTDADGNEFEITRSDGAAPVTVFRAAPAALGAGTYTVEWRGLAGDGHAMKGSFAFEIAP